MNRNIILIALLCLLSIGRTVAQSVTVEAKIDSLQILIGEQAKVQLQVAMDAKQRAVFPAYTDTLVRGVEIIETAKPDTQFLNDRQRMLITQEYIVTSFDSALYYLPPMPVTVDGKEYSSKALALKVYSMPVDTLHPDQFFGQKTVMKAPFAWEDWYGLRFRGRRPNGGFCPACQSTRHGRPRPSAKTDSQIRHPDAQGDSSLS